MNFEQALGTGTALLFDGAMGTELEARGVSTAFAGEANLSAPDVVKGIHGDYCAAGCRVLTTNTFSMNELYLETHGRREQLEDINRTAVDLARSAAARGSFVVGDIGPTGQMLAPLGTYAEDDFYQAFLEQAKVLLAAGVDALLVETMYDLKEALCALRACKDAGQVPVVVSMTFKTAESGGRTMMGNSVADCVQALSHRGATAVGANCGDLSVEDMAKVASAFHAETSLPILAQPNAGIPRLVRGKAAFDLKPAPFAQGLLACRRAGASILGGCCGTSPAHMREAAQLLFPAAGSE